MARKRYTEEQIIAVLKEAQAWRKEYNEERPHSSLNDKMPVEYIQHLLDEAARAAGDSRCLAEAGSLV